MSSPINTPESGSENAGHDQFNQPQSDFSSPEAPVVPEYNWHAPVQPTQAQSVAQWNGADVQQQQTQPKSMIVAAILAFFLGTLGVHNFYLGYTRNAVIQLSMTIIGWILSVVIIGFIPLFIVGVWVFIEFVMILMRNGRYGVDANGYPLQ